MRPNIVASPKLTAPINRLCANPVLPHYQFTVSDVHWAVANFCNPNPMPLALFCQKPSIISLIQFHSILSMRLIKLCEITLLLLLLSMIRPEHASGQTTLWLLVCRTNEPRVSLIGQSVVVVVGPLLVVDAFMAVH